MILAGCPANERHWVIKHWVKYLRRAADYAGEPLAIACIIPEHDHKTQSALQEACLANEVEVFLDLIAEEARPDKRVWNIHRYEHMAMLRNRLLDMVRLLDPPHFLSIDSDILIAREVLPLLIDHLSRFDAVGAKTWLHPENKNIVNWAKIRRTGGMQRQDAHGCFQVDVLMALKLMGKEAFWVDYESHRQGEDFGWSVNCFDKGLKLGWDGSIGSKHIMKEEDLHRIDKRLGW